MIQKCGERVQGCRDPFLLNEPAGLKKTPFAVGWKFALAKWKFLQRNSGAHDVDLVFVATKFDHRALQRCRANENPRDEIEHLLRRFAIGRFVHVDQNVRAVKRNDARFRPAPDQRQKMNRDVTEKNVQKLRVLPVQNCR